jgi:hypothetical protein
MAAIPEPQITRARREPDIVARLTTRRLTAAVAALVILSVVAMPCAPFILMSAEPDADSWLNSIWLFDAVPTVWILSAVGGLLCGARLQQRGRTRSARVVAATALIWAVLTIFAAPFVLVPWIEVQTW